MICPHCVVLGVASIPIAVPVLRALRSKVFGVKRQSQMNENFGILYGKEKK